MAAPAVPTDLMNFLLVVSMDCLLLVLIFVSPA